MKRILIIFCLVAWSALGAALVGLSEAELLKLKGAPAQKAPLGSRVVYRWNDLMAVVEEGRVIKAVPQSGPAQIAPRSTGNFRTPWQDESQFVVEQISADLAEMAYYLKFHSLLTGNPRPAVATEIVPGGGPRTDGANGDPRFVYRVTVHLAQAGDVSADLPLESGFFVPANYVPLLSAIFAKLQLVPPAPSPGLPPGDLLTQLCTPTEKVLADSDLALSKQLETHFGSAAMHERAGLLVAAFGLKETAGNFQQTLVEMCRATAHLALAHQLRPGAAVSDEGRIAEAALTTLCNYETRALQQLDFPTTRPETKAWQRALRTRITFDFRPLDDERQPTLLERLAWFRARCADHLVDETLQNFQPSAEWARLPDWTRMVDIGNPGIAVGHWVRERALPAEIGAWTTVYTVETGKGLEAAAVVPALNAEPQRCVTAAGVRVLGWGLWAAAFQRHFCHVATSHFNFLQHRYGDEEAAAKFRAALDEKFGGLTLFPFVRRENATTEAYYRKAQQDAGGVIQRTPHIVPAEVWNHLCYVTGFCPLVLPSPGPFINEWHRENPLPGTVYDIDPRLNHPSLVNQPDALARLQALHAMAPYERELCYEIVKRVGNNQPNARLWIRTYGPLLDYIPHVAEEVAVFPDASREERIRYLSKAGKYRANGLRLLAKFQISEGHDAEAAANYVRWMERETDAVRIANESWWLINYLENHGQAAEATQLADQAAKTGSAGGLAAKAKLLELRDNYAAACEVYESLAARYNRKTELLGWALRAYAHHPNKQIMDYRDALVAELAPDGLHLLTPQDLAGPPKVGAQVDLDLEPPSLFADHPRNLIAKAGLRKGDILVGLRGYQITSFERYKLIRDMDPGEPLKIKVWRDGRYLDLPPVPAGYRFGRDLTDYRR